LTFFLLAIRRYIFHELNEKIDLILSRKFNIVLSTMPILFLKNSAKLMRYKMLLTIRYDLRIFGGSCNGASLGGADDEKR